MSRRRLLGVAAVVGVLGAAWLTARRAAPRRVDPTWEHRTREAAGRWASLSLAIVAVFGVLALDWIDDFWGGITGGVQDIWNAIVDGVKKLIKAAVNALKRIIDFSVAAIIGWIHDVWNGLQWWVTVLSNAIGAVYDFVRWLVATAVNGLAAIVSQLFAWASAAVQWLANGIGQLASDVFNYIAGVVRWVWSNVFEPLFSFIGNVIQWVLQSVVGLLKGLIDTVWQWAKDAVSFLTDLLGQAWNWIQAFAAFWLKLLEACVKFLVFVAEHPFSWWRIWADQWFRHGGSWFSEHIANWAENAAGDVEDMITRWIE